MKKFASMVCVGVLAASVAVGAMAASITRPNILTLIPATEDVTSIATQNEDVQKVFGDGWRMEMREIDVETDIEHSVARKVYDVVNTSTDIVTLNKILAVVPSDKATNYTIDSKNPNKITLESGTVITDITKYETLTGSVMVDFTNDKQFKYVWNGDTKVIEASIPLDMSKIIEGGEEMTDEEIAQLLKEGMLLTITNPETGETAIIEVKDYKDGAIIAEFPFGGILNILTNDNIPMAEAE